jgi:arylsulfatase A
MITRREALLSFAAAPMMQQRRPNVLMIIADDLGWGDLSCYGQKRFRTPNLDKLASEGLRCTDAYSGNPVCAPSRCTLMTGLHSGHARIRGNHTTKGERYPLQPQDFTMAEMFQQAGYRTGLIGKWGLGEPDTTGIPNKKGFDYFFGYLNQDHAAEHYPEYLWRNTNRVELGRKRYSHELFTEEALTFIGKADSKPWFLDLSYTLPHADMEVPGADRLKIEGATENEAIVAAMVTKLDRDVGKLLEKVDARNTLVLFMSDNGAPGGNRNTAFLNSTGPFRGYKGEVYEGGIRVPFIAKMHGVVPVGAVSNEPLYFADLLPTFAEVIDRPLPKPVDGESVWSVLTSKKKSARKQPMYWKLRQGKKGGQQAVRDGKWKAVQIGGKLELFDLSVDSRETRDLAATHPDVAKRLGAAMDAAHVDSPEYPLT